MRVLYAKIKKGKAKFKSWIFALMYKFDSAPEKRFAIICEQNPEALKWLRPAPK